MKLLLCAFSVSLISLSASAAQPQQKNAVAPSTGTTQMSQSEVENNSLSSLTSKKFTYDVGLTSNQFEYKEGSLMKETMDMQGINVQMTMPLANGALQVTPDLEYVTGNGTYDGGIQHSDGTVTPAKADTNTRITSLRGLVGPRFFAGSNVRIVPFAGLGTSKLENKISGTAGYRREVEYLYLPLGVDFKAKIGETWALGLAAEGDILLVGHVKSYLSDIDSSLPDVENSQTSGTGYRVSASVTKYFQSVAVSLQPYVYHWKVAESQKTYVQSLSATFIEPENETNLVGANVVVTF